MFVLPQIFQYCTFPKKQPTAQENRPAMWVLVRQQFDCDHSYLNTAHQYYLVHRATCAGVLSRTCCHIICPESSMINRTEWRRQSQICMCHKPMIRYGLIEIHVLACKSAFSFAHFLAFSVSCKKDSCSILVVLICVDVFNFVNKITRFVNGKKS